jgi:hypothetical protein
VGYVTIIDRNNGIELDKIEIDRNNKITDMQLVDFRP